MSELDLLKRNQAELSELSKQCTALSGSQSDDIDKLARD